MLTPLRSGSLASRLVVSLRALATIAACATSACSGEDFELVAADATAPRGNDASTAARAPDAGAGAPDTGAARADASLPDARARDGSLVRDGSAAGDRRDVSPPPPARSDASADPRDASSDGARPILADAATSPRDVAASPSDAAPVTTIDASAADSAVDAERPDAALVEAAPGAQRDAVAEASCTAPRTFYRDRDGDGYGSVDDHVSACEAPAPGDAGAWVPQPGDCRDDLATVRPDVEGPVREARYTGQGYVDPTRPGGVSFDMNCDGVEEPDPANLFETEPSCPLLLTGCSGEGYIAVTPERTGPTVNPYCGSTTTKRCVVSGLLCRAEMGTAPEPYRCH